MNINININTIANLATGFIEAYYWCVLCDTFMKRYLKLPKVCLHHMCCMSGSIDRYSKLNIFYNSNEYCNYYMYRNFIFISF